MTNEHRCCWPGCQRDSTVNCVDSGRDHRLCDKHWDLIAAEDNKTEDRARRTVGLSPMLRVPAAPPTPKTPAPKKHRVKKEETTSCSCHGCKEIAVVTVKENRLCDKHWDMYRSRKPDRYWRARELLGSAEPAQEEKEPTGEVRIPEVVEIKEEKEERDDNMDDFASRLDNGDFDI